MTKLTKKMQNLYVRKTPWQEVMDTLFSVQLPKGHQLNMREDHARHQAINREKWNNSHNPVIIQNLEGKNLMYFFLHNYLIKNVNKHNDYPQATFIWMSDPSQEGPLSSVIEAFNIPNDNDTCLTKFVEDSETGLYYNCNIPWRLAVTLLWDHGLPLEYKFSMKKIDKALAQKDKSNYKPLCVKDKKHSNMIAFLPDFRDNDNQFWWKGSATNIGLVYARSRPREYEPLREILNSFDLPQPI